MKTVEMLQDPRIFDVSKHINIIAFATEYLETKHLLTLLDILAKHPHPKTIIQTLAAKKKGTETRLIDHLVAHPLSAVRQAAIKTYGNLYISMRQQSHFALCKTKSSPSKRSVNFCGEELLGKEAEILQKYSFSYDFELCDWDLRFLIHFIESQKKRGQPITQGDRDRIAHLYQEIQGIIRKTAPIPFTQSLSTEGRARHFLLRHEEYDPFLTIRFSGGRVIYVLHDLRFKNPQVFSDFSLLQQELSALYQIDAEKSEVYDLDLLKLWKQKTKAILSTILKEGDPLKAQPVLEEYFSVDGKTITKEFPIDQKKLLSSGKLQFRPQDFLSRWHTLTDKELLDIQALLKEHATLHGTMPLDLKFHEFGPEEKRKAIEAYWRGFTDAFIAIPKETLLSTTLSHHLSQFQIDYLLKTEHFALSERNRDSLNKKIHQSLVKFIEPTFSHARNAVMWLQALIDFSHGNTFGVLTLGGLESYQRIIAPKLIETLAKNTYLNSLVGESFSHSLGKAIAMGPGMILLFVPIGEGIAKMITHSPNSLEFKEGVLELGSGVSFLASSFLTSPIGLFVDLALFTIFTIEGGELGIKQLEQENHVVLEKTLLDKFLVGLGILPANFQKILRQADLENQMSQLAMQLFQNLFPQGPQENSSLPLMTYSWPKFESEEEISISQEIARELLWQYEEAKQRVRSFVKWFSPGLRQIGYVKKITKISPLSFSLQIPQEKIPFSRKKIQDNFPVSINFTVFRYLYTPHKKEIFVYDTPLDLDQRSLRIMLKGDDNSASFTFNEIQVNDQLPPIDQFFPYVSLVSKDANFTGRTQDTLTILGSFNQFSEVFYHPTKYASTIVHAHNYGHVIFSSLTTNNDLLQLELHHVKHLALNFKHDSSIPANSTFLVQDDRIRLNNRFLLFWYSSTPIESFFFSGPSKASTKIILPPILSHVQLSASPILPHHIQSFRPVNGSSIQLEGPSATVDVKFTGKNAFSFIYQGTNGPPVQLTWQEKNGRFFAFLQLGEMKDLTLSEHPFLIYKLLSTLWQLQFELQEMEEIQIFGSYRDCSAQITLSGRQIQALLSLVVPNDQFQETKQWHQNLLKLSSIYYMQNQNSDRIAIGAQNSTLLETALFHLFNARRELRYLQEIDIHGIDATANFWIPPNMAKKIILRLKDTSSLSLQVLKVDSIVREGENLQLFDESNYPYEKRRFRRNLSMGRAITVHRGSTISIENYFPKMPLLYINQVPYEIHNKTSPSICLSASFSRLHPPLFELNRHSLSKACCQIRIKDTQLKEFSFFKDKLQTGSIVLNLEKLSTDLLLTVGEGEREETLTIQQIRILQMKRIQDYKREMTKFFTIPFNDSLTDLRTTAASPRAEYLRSAASRSESWLTWIAFIPLIQGIFWKSWNSYLESSKKPFPRKSEKQTNASLLR